MIKLVIYDCDGVIVDSGEAILGYYNWMMDMCGLPHVDWTNEDLRRIALSYADKDILEILAKGDMALYEKMLYISKNEWQGNNFTEMHLESGIKEGLEIVKKHHLTTAVFTNRGKSLIRLLEHFKIEKNFDMLVTAHDVLMPKPSPEGIYKICTHFGIATTETLFIGDSPTDYHAAKTSGTNFVAFKTELFDAPVIHDHREILVYL